MTDRPILFSAPMVKALLAGTKTQTRRTTGMPVIEQKPAELTHIHNRHGGTLALGVPEDQIAKIAADYCTIQPGDRLWARESLAEQEASSGIRFIGYAADGKHVEHSAAGWPFKRKSVPSIHMPRWASRLTLHVTDVRVERLRDITDDDALAEGVTKVGARWEVEGIVASPFGPKDAYRSLWCYINGDESWTANPWVVAITFDVEHCNIGSARP